VVRSAQAGASRSKSQGRIVWEQFRKHRLAVIGAAILAVLYLLAAFAGFFSVYTPDYYTLSPSYSYAPPTHVYWRDPQTGAWSRPFVYAINRQFDLNTLQNAYVEDRSTKYPIRFLVRTPEHPYSLFKIFHSDLRLLGVAAPARLFLMGSDNFGRDLWSRVVYGGQVSLTIGILSAAISFVLGLLLGGVSGFYQGTRLSLSPGWYAWLQGTKGAGGWLVMLALSLAWGIVGVAVVRATLELVRLSTNGLERVIWIILGLLALALVLRIVLWRPLKIDPDDLIMRLVEIIGAIPTLFLLISLRAVFPLTLSPLFVFYLVVGLLGFIGWGGIARNIRGQVLSLREQDYVVAAKAQGASDLRVIIRHILPATASYVIVVLSLSIPGFILGESGLSFLGLGITEPYTSWGLLLKSAQDGGFASFTNRPWVLIPGVFIFLAILSWNFMGDGLRDAFDPRKRR